MFKNVLDLFKILRILEYYIKEVRFIGGFYVLYQEIG